MIRKITTQEILSKRSIKDREENEQGDPNRRERDFLIERLSRKKATASIADLPVKTKRSTSHRGGFKIGKKWFWMGLPFILIVILIIVLQFMVSAVLTVKPKQKTVQIDTKLIASINATTTPSVLTYQIITLNTQDSESVLATSTITAKAQKASGKITIYNNYSGVAQTLVKNTRFESADGLIFRTESNVRLPGLSVVKGKNVPGSITIDVVADQTGSRYNISDADFTIPGFASDAARFAKIYARSKTAMTGGVDGNSAGLSASDRQNILNKIQARLKDTLLRQVQSQKTANSVIFDSASKISFKHLPDTIATSTKSVVIHEQGTISSIAFDKKMLGKAIMGDVIASLGNNVESTGLEGLRFAPTASSSSPIWQVKPFSFTLSGQVGLTGIVDTSKLLQDVLGKPQSKLPEILANYPTIDKVNLVLKPFWKKTFPTDSTRVKIEVAE